MDLSGSSGRTGSEQPSQVLLASILAFYNRIFAIFSRSHEGKRQDGACGLTKVCAQIPGSRRARARALGRHVVMMMRGRHNPANLLHHADHQARQYHEGCPAIRYAYYAVRWDSGVSICRSWIVCNPRCACFVLLCWVRLLDPFVDTGQSMNSIYFVWLW